MAVTTGSHRWVRLILAIAATVGTVVGCGGIDGGRPPREGSAGSAAEVLPSADGLAASGSGFTLAPLASVLPSGLPASLRFRVVTVAGRTVTAFEPDQTKSMHLYLIRSDLTGFQHVYPTMAPDGTWTADLAAVQPGVYRADAQFTAIDGGGRLVSPVLGVPVTVEGLDVPVPLPPAAITTQVDGYTVTVVGHLMPDMQHQLSVTLARDGRPVTDLQPYLGGFAHLTAFQAKYLTFAHLHPLDPLDSDHAGPKLTFQVTMPEPGNWRFFLEFQTGGVVHTAAITRTVA